MSFFRTALFGAALTGVSHVASAQELQRGVSGDGAHWVIALPEAWQPGDGLVLMQHGFVFVPDTEPTLGPSPARMLEDGYAIAASGYRDTGWAVAAAVDDNVALLERFRATYGEPGTVVTYGGSMGAFIALKLAEDDRIRSHIDGVVALCPAVDGVGTWDRAFDLRVAYDALCADVPGGQLPSGAAPLPWASDLDILTQAPTDPLGFPAAIRALAPVQACLALHVPQAQRDPAADARVSALKQIAGTQDEEQFAALMNYAVFGLADLVRSPHKLDGANPFFNRARARDGSTADLNYRAAHPTLPPSFDANVQRVQRDDITRLTFHRDSSLDGSASARIVSVHTSGDGIALAREQGLLARRFEHAPMLIGVAKEFGATHCGFSQGEYDAAWDTMQAWLEDGDAHVPVLAALQANCEARTLGPCRFDAEATAAALEPSPSLRPAYTDPLVPPRSSTVGGLWWDPARPGQGVMIEELDDPVGLWRAGEQRVAVAWYTWAPAADPQPGPRWFYGTGRVYGDGIVVDPLYELSGGRFGAALDPASVQTAPWGRMLIDFSSDAARASYAGPPAYGSGEMHIGQLTTAGTGLSPDMQFSPPLRYNFTRQGTYIDPQHPAGGWMLGQYPSGDDGTFRVGSLLVWFTWDPNGRPVWFYGTDDDAFDGIAPAMMRAASGGTFEPGNAAENVRLLPWGEVELVGCASGHIDRVAWRAETHGYGDGDVAVARLTQPTVPHSVSDCP